MNSDLTIASNHIPVMKIMSGTDGTSRLIEAYQDGIAFEIRKDAVIGIA